MYKDYNNDEKIKEGWTTIRISITTKDELTEIGKKGETYDDIIRKIIKVYKEVVK